MESEHAKARQQRLEDWLKSDKIKLKILQRFEFESFLYENKFWLRNEKFIPNHQYTNLNS